MRRSSFEVSVSTVFFQSPLRLLRSPAPASKSRWSSISAFKTRSAKAFFSSSNSPSLAKTACGSRPASKPSRVSFLIAICALHRRHYGPAHKIPDSPIPAHAEDDYFAIEMAALEEFVHVEHSSALSFEQSAGKLCCVNPVRTRAFLWAIGREVAPA